MTFHCTKCGEPVPPGRVSLGYTICMPCGERGARTKRHCIVPMHKGNYVPVTNREDLRGINNKGGLHNGQVKVTS